MRHVRLLFLGLFLTLSFIHLHAQTCPAVGSNDKRAEQWKIGMHYDVYLDPSSPVLTTCRGDLQAALDNWQNSSANYMWGVSFGFTNTMTNNTLNVYHRPPTAVGNPPRCVPSDAGCFRSFSDQDPMHTGGSGIISGAFELHPDHLDCGALAQTFAHELGHPFGLADCLTCSSNTIMGPAPTNAAGKIVQNTSLPNGPTSCDETKVREYTDDTIEWETENEGCVRHACAWGTSWDLITCSCVDNPPHEGDPLILDLAGDGLDLTSVFDGVLFDLRGRGIKRRMGWTARNSDDAWLALDRNGNGAIDDGRELFSDAAEQAPSNEPNGFLALAVFDQPSKGGNGDGRIDAADRGFASLVVWQDRNHDGKSQPAELSALAATGVEWIELDYSASGRHDRNGNYLRYRAKIGGAKGAGIPRWAYDVFVRVAE